jgi:hypothetical protein
MVTAAVSTTAAMSTAAASAMGLCLWKAGCAEEAERQDGGRKPSP